MARRELKSRAGVVAPGNTTERTTVPEYHAARSPDRVRTAGLEIMASG
jgi:hypothetical protein